VWMSHGDRVDVLPPGFEPSPGPPTLRWPRPRTASAHLRAAVPSRGGPHPAGQGHLPGLPLRRLQALRGLDHEGFAEEAVETIRDQVGQGKVICASPAAWTARWPRCSSTGPSVTG
jgi:GMP synthase (glutamine-hydrolysing)